MGGKLTRQSEEPDEVIKARTERSQLMHQKRERSRQVYSSMISRVLQDEDAINASYCQDNIPSRPSLMYIPDPAVLLIVKYCAQDLRSMLAVSPLWHFRILEVLDLTFSTIESNFALIHSHVMLYNKGFMNTGVIQVSTGTGIRVDRVLVAELLPVLRGYTIKLRYTYRIHGKPHTYKSEFKFDCIGKGKRIVWAHRDECKFHGDDQKRSYTQQIPSICIGDKVEFAFNWYSLQGLVDIESVDWQPPLIQDTRGVLKSLQLAPNYAPRSQGNQQDDIDTMKKKLYLYNIARHCEVELTQTEWYDKEYYIKPRDTYTYDHFAPFLKLISTEFAGVDVTISRNTYKAIKPGIVPDSLGRIGILIEVKRDNDELTEEVKRMGLLFDRHRQIQLRVGDTFILYISRGGQ